jgi:thioredoxin-dependent peroxiredoxin
MKTGKIVAVLMALALVFLNHAANAEPSATLKVGQPAPDFNLPDQDGKTRTLEDFRGKWLVLYFYVKDDTPECTEQARGFRDYIPELAALRAQVVGVSVDDSTSHAHFARKYALAFPLLADSTGETAARYHSLGGDGRPGNLAKRNTFLIDPQGRIAKIYLSVSPSRNPIEVIEDLKRVNGF